ncbi:GNAT family N-acetyltransferase [Schaalia sp. lx-100]|uniref:GNAT family N-acetyltransferase n=1 Tax=Schaalia sp. lx-100 TaxID=2899081 RepID=UPI001E3CC624|nr:GNAT family N-acetyltransferase [Schaalia sp. lx-100]MCD4557611.1 GNAT family N-acetyltransferase [Schaalia sp. lx-100]
MRLVKASVEDVETIRTISIETFTETFAADNTAEDMERYIAHAFHTEVLKKEVQNPDSQFFLAFLDEELAGYLKINVGTAQTEDRGPHCLEIERIYVRKAAKNRGLGKLMVHHACEQARILNLEVVWLGVWEHNKAAQTFYEKLGFQTVGAHTFVLGDDVQKDLIMERNVGRL